MLRSILFLFLNYDFFCQAFKMILENPHKICFVKRNHITSLTPFFKQHVHNYIVGTAGGTVRGPPQSQTAGIAIRPLMYVSNHDYSQHSCNKPWYVLNKLINE